MDKNHPLLPELVALSDSVDMAMMWAERGDDCSLHAWLEEIQDEASKLVGKTKVTTFETDDES